MIQYTGNGNDLFYEPKFNTFFKSRYQSVLEGYLEFIRNIIINTCRPSMDYFYTYLNLEPPRESKEWGWNYDYLAEEWNTIWIDVLFIPDITEDGIPFIRLDYPMEPKPMDYLEGKYD